MVNKFGDYTRGDGGAATIEEFLENVVRKVLVTSGRCVDYINKIRISHKLGCAAYRVAPNKSLPTLIFIKVHEIGSEAITKENYLAYWKEGTRGMDNITPLRGDRGIRGKRGSRVDT